MALVRDHGTCCIFVPLKLGVSLVAMLVFLDAVLSLLATFTGDIRLQPNGYSERFYHLPSVLGIFGLVLGRLAFQTDCCAARRFHGPAGHLRRQAAGGPFRSGSRKVPGAGCGTSWPTSS